MLENTEGDNHEWTIKKIWQHLGTQEPRGRQTKQKHNTICVRCHYIQANANNVNLIHIQVICICVYIHCIFLFQYVVILTILVLAEIAFVIVLFAARSKVYIHYIHHVTIAIGTLW
jgi:hypothetical protein